MAKETDEQTADKLKAELAKMDEWFAPLPPDMQWFEAQVEAEHKRLAAKKRREWALFCILAAAILGAGIAAAAENPVYFLCIQVAGVLALPLALLYEKRKKAGGPNDTGR
ncbi:hypothetical protein EBB07_04665 [Paenibacillaceae bacterium]|nr:hypothetical protein EBB07_04665 [Paenibacillaceae bacterium]